jgi:hypothetical protein
MTQEVRARKIVVEAIIPAPVEVVWERSQVPEQHTAWDIRFTHIGYLDETDERGYRLMDYGHQHRARRHDQGLRAISHQLRALPFQLRIRFRRLEVDNPQRARNLALPAVCQRHAFQDRL